METDYLNFGYDNSTFVGVLANTAERFGNLLIHGAYKGVTSDVRNLNAFFEVVNDDHESIKDAFSAVVQLFIKKAKKGATHYVTFIGKFVNILYGMLVNMLNLSDITRGLLH